MTAHDAAILANDTTVGVGPWDFNIGLLGGLAILGFIIVLVVVNLK